MELYCVIFVVFVSLLAPSNAHQQLTVYGLSEEKSTQFHEIVDKQNATMSTVFSGINPIFDVLEILSFAQKDNSQCDSSDYATLISGAVAIATTSCDHIFTLIPMIVGGSCPAAETGRIAAHGHLENVYANVGHALSLAFSKNFTDIRTQVEPFSVAAKASLTKFIEEFSVTIRACINITNANTLAALKAHETQSTNDGLTACDVVFDAIKVVAAGIPITSSTTAGIVPNIESYRQRACSVMEKAVEHCYTIIRGLYISYQLDKPELASRFMSDQHTQIVADNSYRRSAGLMFNIMREYLAKVQLGLSGGCEYSSAIDVAQAKSAENFKTGLRTLVESVPTTDSATSARAQAALEYFNNFSENAANSYYTGIRLALGQQGSTYAETVTQIQGVEAALQATFPNMFHTIFSLIKLASGTKVEVTNFQTSSVEAVHNWAANAFKGVYVLAKACHGVKPVTREDFNELRNAQNGIDPATDLVNSNISFGYGSVIKTINGLLSAVTQTVNSVVTPVTNLLKITAATITDPQLG